MGLTHRTKIGILGGTFDPIHLGHLLIAQDALEQAGLDRVTFIPCATPPHKKPAQLTSPAHRLRMVQLAIRGDDRFAVDDLEIRRGGVSYSVDTLLELRRREPVADLYFIVGSDNLRELPLWRETARLRKLCTFLTVLRPGFDPPRDRGPRGRIVTGHTCAIASRDLRGRVARGLSIRYLVPDAVLRYIQTQKLYR